MSGHSMPSIADWWDCLHVASCWFAAVLQCELSSVVHSSYQTATSRRSPIAGHYSCDSFSRRGWFSSGIAGLSWYRAVVDPECWTTTRGCPLIRTTVLRRSPLDTSDLTSIAAVPRWVLTVVRRLTFALRRILGHCPKSISTLRPMMVLFAGRL